MSFGIKVNRPLCLLLLNGILANSVQAQSIPVVSGNSGTVVNQNGNTVDITGTNFSKDGANLFHSFQQFGLNQGQIANFLANPSVQNILGRVTGGNASVIDGLIRITSTDPSRASNANLYLMNPTGIVFGPNASLNVPGSFIATTANGIGFNNKWFNAIGTNNYADLVGNPETVAFTMSQPGAIVNAGNLAVQTGKNLVLVGGTVVSTAPISSAYAGITIAAVPGSSFVRISQPGSLLSLEIQPSSLASSLPTNLPASQKVASLAQLLTGGNKGSNYGLTVGSDGQVTITGSNVPIKNGDVVLSDVSGGSLYVSSTGDLIAKKVETSLNPINRISADITLVSEGKVIVDTIRVKQEGFTYDGQEGMTIRIKAFDVFQARGTFPISSGFSGVTSIPTSVITQGRTYIEHGGQTFTVGLGVERDAAGNIVYRAPSKQSIGETEPVFIAPNSFLLRFIYADGSPASNVSVRSIPFNPNGVASNISFTAGAILNGAGVNATLYGSLQNAPFAPGSNSYFQVSRIERPSVPSVPATPVDPRNPATPTNPANPAGFVTSNNSSSSLSPASTNIGFEPGQGGQVVQQRLNRQNVACGSSSLAMGTGGSATLDQSTSRSTSSVESNDCGGAGSSTGSAADDAQILKVLGEQ
jgi:filamentous hemagglutinin family protein